VPIGADRDRLAHDNDHAFEFNVNASGVLVDSLLFNDTDVAENWDENWDAPTRVTARGWTAEILRRPLRAAAHGPSNATALRGEPGRAGAGVLYTE